MGLSKNKRHIPPLSATFVRKIQRPGAYGDGRGGHGLTLRLKPRRSGGVTKHWVQRLRIHGKPVNIGLGPYPVVSLAEARETALANRREVHKGRDPRIKPRKVPTFAEAAKQVITLKAPTWKSGEQEARIWHSSFEQYVLPHFGLKPVSEIATSDVLAVLTPIWQTKQETARRVRQRLAVVFRACIAQGYRKDNPAGEAIGDALPLGRRKRKHYRALPYSEVGEALRTVRKSDANKATILCFEFLVLCAARSGEARLATWSEIDLPDRAWIVPAERMKSERLHRVPLSKRAMKVLHEANALGHGTDWLFPSPTGKPVSNMTLPKLLKDLEIAAVPHGFRASFRTWAEEQTDAPRAVMEAALAHRLGDAAEQAYARSDLFQKRRVLMDAWAAYLSANQSESCDP